MKDSHLKKMSRQEKEYLFNKLGDLMAGEKSEDEDCSGLSDEELENGIKTFYGILNYDKKMNNIRRIESIPKYFYKFLKVLGIIGGLFYLIEKLFN